MASTAASSDSGSASARNPTWPRLTPEHRNAGGPGQFGRAEERAVAAQRENELAAFGRMRRVEHAHRFGHAGGSLEGKHPHFDAGFVQLAAGAVGEGDDLAAGRVRDDQDRSHAELPSFVTICRISSSVIPG